MKKLLVLLIAASLYGQNPKPEPTIESLKADVAKLQAEIKLLKARNAWCQTELNIWGQNPDVVQVRLDLMRQEMAATVAAKSAKEIANADKSSPTATPAIKPAADLPSRVVGK